MDFFIAGPVIQIFNQTWHRLSLREAFKIYTFFSNECATPFSKGML